MHAHPGLRLRCLVFLAALVSLAPLSAFAAETGFVNRILRDADGDHKYVVFLPNRYSAQTARQQRWPVMLFLHGAGECGSDGRKQLSVALGPYLQAHADTFPYVVVFPQCEETRQRILTRWKGDSADGKRAVQMLDAAIKVYNLDSKRQVLTGWSMGGYGAWSLGAAHASRWKAVVPLAGGGDPATVSALKDTPVWAIHGARDTSVLPEESQKMVDALREAGGKPHYTAIPDVGHDVYNVAYGDALWQWLRNPAASTPADPLTAVRVRAGTASAATGTPAPQMPSLVPFAPAVHIPQAVYVRMGNDMLADLSRAIPAVTPRDALSGRLNDIFSSTSTQGINFSVQFSGISYSGQLTRAAVKAYGKDRLNVQLALSNVQLYISGTYVNGGRRSATAGPISIVFGHRYPVWLSFDVTPYNDRGRIKLRLLQTRFSIPQDNWYVSGPAGVSVRGFGMTSERVSSGLVSGLYGSKYRIESEVSAVVPSLLAQLEQKLDLSQLDTLTGGIWPLPVYRPQMRTWVEEISTDANGVTIVLGATIAAIDPAKAPAKAKWLPATGLSAAEVPHDTQLRVGVAPALLQPMSQLLVDADMARIHVLDTPVKALAHFADPAFLGEVIPDFQKFDGKTEIWPELVLKQPIKIAEEAEEKNGTFPLELPELLVSISVKPEGATDWMPYAEVSYKIIQHARPEVIEPTSITRGLLLSWDETGTFETHARFAPGYEPEKPDLDIDRLRTVFEEAWAEFTGTGPASTSRIPDIDFGYTKLRLDEAEWAAPYLSVGFAPAGVRLSNQSDKPFTYETKGPYSGWSKPFTLQPGQTHKYEVAYPLAYRRAEGKVAERYTLPAGSHAALRTPKAGGTPRVYQLQE